MNSKSRKLPFLIVGISLVITVVFFIRLGENREYPIAMPEMKPSRIPQIDDVSGSSLKKTDTTVKENIILESLYQVDIELNVEKHYLIGKSKVEVWNTGNLTTNEIKFQLYLNAFNEGKQPPVLKSYLSKTYPNGLKHGGVKISRVFVDGKVYPYKSDGIVMAIQLDSAWEPGTKRVVSMEWRVDIPKIHHRVGMDGENFWFGNTIPILAARDNGWKTNQYEMVGDPFNSDVANYIVNIKTPSEYETVATGNETSQLSGGVRLTSVEARKVRDFTFAVFKESKKTSIESAGNIQVNLYYKKAKDDVAEKAVEQAAAFLIYMEQLLIDYPYAELDIFENEMFITGMEYPGMIYIDSDRLRDPYGVQTLLHEIAHQWFYNIVGNDQIKEPWLDEGFATFYTNRYMQSQGLIPKVSTGLLANERKKHSLKIADINEYTGWGPYWQGVYQRGSYLLFDLQRMMGEDAFDDMLKEYVGKYSYKNVTTRNFQDEVQRHISTDISAFWNEWFNL